MVAEITPAVFHSVCYIFPLYCHRKRILEKIRECCACTSEQLETPLTEDLKHTFSGIKKLPPQDNLVTLILLTLLYDKLFPLF